MARLGMVGAAEAQRVHVGHGPRAHGEDVAQDAADAGRGPLVGLDEAGVVVALDLEDRGQSLADIHDPGILARPADHPGSFGRQRLQPYLRALVGAMLGPHCREHAKLGDVRLAPHDLQDQRIFVGRKAMFGGQFGRDRDGFGCGCRDAHAASTHYHGRMTGMIASHGCWVGSAARAMPGIGKRR